MMNSLQSRLILWIGLAITSVLIVAGVLLYAAVHRALLEEFDRSLVQTSQEIAQLIESDGSLIESELAEQEFPQFARQQNPDLYQILDGSGKTIESSSGLQDQSLPLVSPDTNVGSIKNPAINSVTFPDGRPGRMAALQTVPRFDAEDAREEGHQIVDDFAPAPVILLVGRDTVELNASLARLRRLTAIVMSAAILIGLLAAAFVAKFSLASLRKTVSQISDIDEDKMELRLNPDDAPTEVQPTIRALNQMLDRLTEAFHRERRFSSNVAHELRNPLGGIKGTIEVALSRDRDPGEYRAALEKSLAICNQTQGLVENLLRLARIDANQNEVYKENFDLAKLVSETWCTISSRLNQRNLAAELDIAGPVVLSSDRNKIQVVLRNLMDNAICYSKPGSTIKIVCSRENDYVRFEVSNVTGDLQAADLNHVYDRFWRGDDSRTQIGEHSGLGLSLCLELVKLLGGTIESSLSEDFVFRTEVILPGVSRTCAGLLPDAVS